MTLCGWVGWVGGYDQLCCPASPKLLLGLDLGLGCDNSNLHTCHNPHVMICHKMTQTGIFMTYFDIWHFLHDACNMARWVSKEPS